MGNRVCAVLVLYWLSCAASPSAAALEFVRPQWPNGIQRPSVISMPAGCTNLLTQRTWYAEQGILSLRAQLKADSEAFLRAMRDDFGNDWNQVLRKLALWMGLDHPARNPMLWFGLLRLELEVADAAARLPDENKELYFSILPNIMDALNFNGAAMPEAASYIYEQLLYLPREGEVGLATNLKLRSMADLLEREGAAAQAAEMRRICQFREENPNDSVARFESFPHRMVIQDPWDARARVNRRGVPVDYALMVPMPELAKFQQQRKLTEANGKIPVQFLRVSTRSRRPN